MLGKIRPPQLSFTKEPPAGYHFLVVFLAAGVLPNPLDIRFQKVSGISVEIETTEIREGGENIFVHRLPMQAKYNNLVLERGMVVGSPLNVEFNAAMTLFQFVPGNVLVVVLNKDSVPVAGWNFQRAYPVKWSVSDLDATQNGIVVDTMELAYTRFQSVRI